MIRNFRTVSLVLLPALVTVILSYYLQLLIVANQQQFNDWLASFGSYVILIYIILQAVTVVVAPIGGFFLIVAMIALFGPATALTLAYLVTTPCFLINFYLARRYGRPLVTKIIGHGALKKMDRFIDNAGLKLLVILRLFQSSNFDYLAYAFGLTTVSFRTFTVINFLIGIPAAYLAYLIYSNSGSLAKGVAITYIIGAIFAGLSILLTLLLNRKSST